MHAEDDNLANVKMILSCLYSIRGVLAPFSQLFDLVGSEFERFLSDPFDIKKYVAISEQRILYEHFGQNPLHAWQAVYICQEGNLQQYPQWALNIILKSAKGMVALGAVEGILSSKIKKALEIDGHKVSQFQDNMFWLEVFHETHALIESGMSQKEAFFEISQRHHGKAGAEQAVERRFFEYRAKLKDIPLPHALDP